MASMASSSALPTPSAMASTRRSLSPAHESVPPPAKRQKLDSDSLLADPAMVSKNSTATTETAAENEEKSTLNYRDAVVLAPMVRSGTLPSRLLALKYGADLVWGPEIVDRAMIGCTRVVDDVTGGISYERGGRQIWSTHPVEKPYLIYQIGSSTPELAVQAALMVADDVSGVELNCGCPKPFSTHSGMGANLLSTPDLLCAILTALRAALPPKVAVSAKIRLLPTQEETIALVRRIVNTGVSCITVHCRLKEQRMREKATIERLKKIVQSVEEMGRGVPVIANGDCLSRDDAVRMREVTGAHSAMIATAAEKNLSCFRAGVPLADAESELAPSYIALARYLKNPWGNSKHCLSQFSSSYRATATAAATISVTPSSDHVTPSVGGGGGNKAALKEFKQRLSQAKDYDAFADIKLAGEDLMAEVQHAVTQRQRRLEMKSTSISSRTGIDIDNNVNAILAGTPRVTPAPPPIRASESLWDGDGPAAPSASVSASAVLDPIVNVNVDGDVARAQGGALMTASVGGQ